MGLFNPESILTDLNGNYYGVSGSMQLPIGALGQLITGVDNSVSGSQLVTYLSMSNGAIVVTGTVNSQVTFPAEIGVIVGNWPLVIGTTGSHNVYTSGPQAVSGTVGAVINNWPAVLGVSGSQLTGSTFSGFPVVAGGVFSGSQYAVTALQTDRSGALYVTTSGTLPVAIVGTVPITVAGTLPVLIQNQPAVVGVSGSVNVYTSGLQGVSGTVGAVIQNWPATLGVSASATLPVAIQNQPAVIGVSGSVNVYTSGLQGVSGTVGAVIDNWPAVIAVSGSQLTGSTFSGFPVVAGGVYSGSQYAVTALRTDISGALYITTSGTLPVNVTFPAEIGVIVGNQPAVIGVSGSVNVYTSGLQGVSGTVGAVIDNWPLTQAMSGSQLTGSTFSGFPVVAGGVFSGSQYAVTALQTDRSGALYITTSGTLPVAIVGTVPITVAGTLPVTIQNQPAVVGVSGSVNVYTSGLQGVSGTVSAVIQNWPALIGVSGSVTVGGYGLNVTGSVISTPIPAPFTNVTSVNASTANQALLASNTNRLGATFFNEGASTLYLKMGLVASVTSYSVQIGAKGYYELPAAYTGEVDGIFSTNVGAVRITELT